MLFGMDDRSLEEVDVERAVYETEDGGSEATLTDSDAQKSGSVGPVKEEKQKAFLNDGVNIKAINLQQQLLDHMALRRRSHG